MRNKIKQIGIDFKDNDYYNTFRVLLPLLVQECEDYNNLLDKKYICSILKEASYGCYILGQNKLKYNSHNAALYLKENIKEDKIFINEELTEYINSTFHNSEIFCVTIPQNEYETAHFWAV